MYTKNLRTACKCNAGPSNAPSYTFLSHTLSDMSIFGLTAPNSKSINGSLFEILHSKLLGTGIFNPIKHHAYFQ